MLYQYEQGPSLQLSDDYPARGLCGRGWISISSISSGSKAALAKATLPPHAVAALGEPPHASFAVHPPVSLEGFALGPAGGGGG